jgi:hypothetical protein
MAAKTSVYAVNLIRGLVRIVFQSTKEISDLGENWLRTKWAASFRRDGLLDQARPRCMLLCRQDQRFP